MRIELPDHKKAGFTPVRFLCVGATWTPWGICNNTYYFRYFETARIDWLTSLGAGHQWQGR